MIKFFLCLFINAIIALSIRECIDDTEWAQGYSDDKFNSVHLGMSKNDVQILLGEPMTVWTRGSYLSKISYEVWDYTDSPNDSHYAIRQIEFNLTGKVRRVIKYYWWD